MVLRIDNAPGALLGALAEFGIRGIDLTRIESRPTRTELGTYLFFTICTAAVFGAFLNALLASLVGEGTSLGYGIAAVACLLVAAYMNTRDTTTVSRSLLAIEGVGIAGRRHMRR